MKKLFIAVALIFSMKASAFRVFNSQVTNFNKIDKNIYSCEVVLQKQVITCYINKELMDLIKSNRVALDLKWESKDKGMRFYLIPSFKNEPR